MKKVTVKKDTLQEHHDAFVKRYIRKERENRVESAKNKVGRKPVPESQRREKNVIRAYVSDEELQEIRAFIGDRSASDVIRTLVLKAAKNARK